MVEKSRARPPVSGSIASPPPPRLGIDYPWPGNIREREQCVRNVMIRQEYRPAADQAAGQDDWQLASLREGAFTVNNLVLEIWD